MAGKITAATAAAIKVLSFIGSSSATSAIDRNDITYHYGHVNSLPKACEP